MTYHGFIPEDPTTRVRVVVGEYMDHTGLLCARSARDPARVLVAIEGTDPVTSPVAIIEVPAWWTEPIPV